GLGEDARSRHAAGARVLTPIDPDLVRHRGPHVVRRWRGSRRGLHVSRLQPFPYKAHGHDEFPDILRNPVQLSFYAPVDQRRNRVLFGDGTLRMVLSRLARLETEDRKCSERSVGAGLAPANGRPYACWLTIRISAMQAAPGARAASR